ncbi:MAG: hypothetical protein DRJ57_02395 [Thermoprotei archaeon]|nr:MAG: hypothetical protein DRJ57_02395 [Thermoprotei archaeon]
MSFESIAELYELSRAIARAFEVVRLLKKRAEKHIVEGVPPKRQYVKFRVNIEGKRLDLTEKQAAALLVLSRTEGAEVLNAIARSTGLNSKLALGLALQLKAMGLVNLIITPQRKIVMLTPFGQEVAKKVEEMVTEAAFPPEEEAAS